MALHDIGDRKFRDFEDLDRELVDQFVQGPHDSGYFRKEDVRIVTAEDADGRQATLMVIPEKVAEFLKNYMSFSMDSFEEGDLLSYDKERKTVVPITVEEAVSRFPSIADVPGIRPKGKGLSPVDLVPMMDTTATYRFLSGKVTSRATGESLDIRCGIIAGADGLDADYIRDGMGQRHETSELGLFGVEWVEGHPETATLIKNIDSVEMYDSGFRFCFGPALMGVTATRAAEILGCGRDGCVVDMYLDAPAIGIDLVDVIQGREPRQDSNGLLAYDDVTAFEMMLPHELGYPDPEVERLSKALSPMGVKVALPDRMAFRSAEMEPLKGEVGRTLVEVPVGGRTLRGEKLEKGDFIVFSASRDLDGGMKFGARPEPRGYVRDSYPQAFRPFADDALDRRTYGSIWKTIQNCLELPHLHRVSGSRLAVIVPEGLIMQDRYGNSSGGSGDVLTLPEQLYREVERGMKAPEKLEAEARIYTAAEAWRHGPSAPFTEDDKATMRESFASRLEWRWSYMLRRSRGEMDKLIPAPAGKDRRAPRQDPDHHADRGGDGKAAGGRPMMGKNTQKALKAELSKARVAKEKGKA